MGADTQEEEDDFLTQMYAQMYEEKTEEESVTPASHVVRVSQTGANSVSDPEANTTWTTMCTYFQTKALDGKTVSAASRFTDAHGAGDQITTQQIDYGSPQLRFTVRLYRYDTNPRAIKVQVSEMRRHLPADYPLPEVPAPTTPAKSEPEDQKKD